MGSMGLAARSLEPCTRPACVGVRANRGASRQSVRCLANMRRAFDVRAKGSVSRCSPANDSERIKEAGLLVALGGIALALGLIVYLTDRDASHAALIPEVAALAGSNVFGALGQWLPAAVHPFAFSLLTAAALPSRLAWRYGACAAWCVVNIAFEVGQHPLFSGHLVSALQATSGQFVPGRALSSYFLHGTFDAADIVAGAFGALLAAAFLGLTQHIWETDHAA
jgi:hypothetical protein